MQHKIKSYQQALDYLKGKKRRPYAHNTRIELDPLDLGHENIVATYHGNIVASFFPDGTSTFSSCGWKTHTTKERINWFLPDGFSVYQERSVWYLSDRGAEYSGPYHTYIFADGLAIKGRTVYNAGEADRVKPVLKALKKYVDGYVKALLNGEVGKPSGGDCWYCAMHTQEGKPLGTATGSTDHLELHFEESYYVPSLLTNAATFFADMNRERMSVMSKDGVARLWQGESISDWQKSIVARDVKATLTAYLKHEFGLPA